MLSISAVLQKIEEPPSYISQEDEEREYKGCKAGEFVFFCVFFVFFVANYCQLAQTLFCPPCLFSSLLGDKDADVLWMFLKSRRLVSTSSTSH